MSDRDDVKALLIRLGVPFAESRPYAEVAEDKRKYTEPDRSEIVIGPGAATDSPWHVATPGDPAKVDGYTGFECVWTFTPEGQLVKVGVWE